MTVYHHVTQEETMRSTFALRWGSNSDREAIHFFTFGHFYSNTRDCKVLVILE
jgi:hypothetical protein